MSIWTQVFLVNIIVFVTYSWVDRGILSDSIEKWFYKGKVRSWVLSFYALCTLLSFPAWLIYLVLS